MATVDHAVLSMAGRLDAAYHLSPGIQAARQVDNARDRGMEVRPLGGAFGVGKVRQPGRFKRQYAAPKETSVPYLKPYDIFDYLPFAREHLSLRRSANLEELVLERDTLLLTCSGRNLGPVVAVDAYLRRFALSHDVIRIRIPDPQTRWVALTFLNSPVGQELIRRDRSGSVIDHIGVHDAEAIPMPALDGLTRHATAALAGAAVRAREQARIILDHAAVAFESGLAPLERTRPAGGWTVMSSEIHDRVDAAPYAPPTMAWAGAELVAGGTRLGDVARVDKPASRYKAYHVSAKYGEPFLAGGQTGQWAVIGAKHMADRVFDDPDRYRLRAGQVVFPADGRAHHGLGRCSMVTSERDGWLASEHVIRLTARPGVDPGWLFAAVSSEQVQEQIQSLARGSVVDTLYSNDLENVVLPPAPTANAGGLGGDVAAAWDLFSVAESLTRKAVALMDSALLGEGVDGSGPRSLLTTAEVELVAGVAGVAVGADTGGAQPVVGVTRAVDEATLALMDFIGGEVLEPSPVQRLPEGLLGVVTHRYANSVLALVDAQDHTPPFEVELGLEQFGQGSFHRSVPGLVFDWVSTDRGTRAIPRPEVPVEGFDAQAWTQDALAFLDAESDSNASD